MARFNDSGNVLNEEDLAEILHILGTSVTKWREIGVALGLWENVLNRIEHENRDLMSCLRKMISEWLKKNYNTERFGEPTWEKLAAAVKSSVGGSNSALAQKIARKHGTHIGEVKERITINDDHPTTCCWPFCCLETRSSISRVDSRTTLLENSHMVAAASSSSSSSIPTTVTTESISIDNSSPRLLQATPTWMLKDIQYNPSYHGALTGRQANYVLRKCGGTCYLLRYSENKKAFVLSVLIRNDNDSDDSEAFHTNFANFKLKITKGDDDQNIYEIDGSEERFQNINELLKCYSTTPLSPAVTNIGRPCTKRNQNKRGVTL